jgi:hypothetical protein
MFVDGVRAAIMERNCAALRSVLELHEAIRYFSGLRRRLSTTHCLMAIEQSEDPAMFQVMMRATEIDIPIRNPEVIECPIKLKEQDDALGARLIDMINTWDTNLLEVGSILYPLPLHTSTSIARLFSRDPEFRRGVRNQNMEFDRNENAGRDLICSNDFQPRYTGPLSNCGRA